MGDPKEIRFFIDHCVPDSVGRMLAQAGHDVVLLRQRLAPDSPDPLVAAFAELTGAILVSIDTDFQNLAPRMAVGRQRFQKLSRIGLRCSEHQAAQRVGIALSLIEHEWGVAQGNADKRLIIEITHNSIRTIR